MKPKYFSILGAAALLTAASPLLHPTTAQALSTEVEPKEEDVQILTRGPVHEAFADAIGSKPEAGYIVTKAPPSPIEELPPEQQLEGENVTWISGYWAWDDDTTDFLWISGVWRNIPPGRQWVPGYWNDLNDGRWQWVSGYWADNAVEEVDYVEEAPPASVDAGPNVEAPNDDSSWVPGNWRYVETRYVWSPGYWAEQRPDWNWVPSRWCWAPRGYYYVNGYWDYALANRGVLFAPICFNRPLWSRPGYCYTPSVVVSLGVFDSHCWYRPRYNHCYFGDYYGPRYSDLGFFASYGWHGRRGCYDPIWAHNYWTHRHDIGWRNRVADRYNFFRDNADARPLRTWAAMRDFRNDRFSGDERSRSRLFASSLAGFARNPVRGERFTQLTAQRRDQFVAQRQQLRDFAQNRRQVENTRLRQDNVAGNANGNNRSAVVRANLRRSPVSGRPLNQIAQNQAAPRRPLAAGSSARVRPDAVVRPNATAGRNIAQQMQQSMRPNNGAAAQANRNRVQPNIGRSTQREGQAAQPNVQRRQQQAGPQRQAQRSPQVAPQQRQQVRQQTNTAPRTRQQQAAPQRQQIQPRQQQQVRPQQRVAPQQQRQQVRPQVQRVAPQQRQSAQRPQVQRAAPQPRQQVRPQVQRAAPQRQSVQRPQVQRAAPQRQSVQRPQVQRSRPSSSVQRQSVARPQVQRAAPQRQSVQRSSVQRSSSQRQSSGRTRN